MVEIGRRTPEVYRAVNWAAVKETVPQYRARLLAALACPCRGIPWSM